MTRPSDRPGDCTKLIEEHLPLVRHIVFQVAVHFPRHVDRDELATAGALGLVEAARRYDESRGVPFDRFAAQRIRGAILDAVRAADWAPRSVRTLARKLESVEQRLATELGRVPSADEMAEALGMSRDELQPAAGPHVPLGRPGPRARGQRRPTRTSPWSTCSPTTAPSSRSEELETRELHAYLRDAVHLLPERHRLVVVGYFLEGRTSQELARFLGVTESRVSQLRSEALEMLREGIEAQYEAETGRAAEPARAGSPAARPATPPPSPRPRHWHDRIGATGRHLRLSLRLRAAHPPAPRTPRGAIDPPSGPCPREPDSNGPARVIV